MDYSKIITAKRRRSSEVPDRGLTEELASDRSRILYSPPFRRLGQKAQVFSLESNAAVRNRVTHSLEVSDVGRWIAYYVTEDLINREDLKRDLQLPFLYAVECACLLHDIGNPPFGHFGEAAIKEWFRGKWISCYKKARNLPVDVEINDTEIIRTLIKDFLEFDGNPQGLRIILRLQRDKDQYSLNLTYTTILSFIKYTRSTSEEGDDNLKKKAGYFESERKIVEKMKEEIDIAPSSRYPLAHIMEAADDIAYCISDIEDGIEKGVITVGEFFEELNEEWKKLIASQSDYDFPIGKIDKQKEGLDKFFHFKTSFTRAAIKRAKSNYLKCNFLENQRVIAGLFSDDNDYKNGLKCLKNVARRKLFRSSEAENPELAGYTIITGLLNSFEPLLSCSRQDFTLLIESQDNPSMIAGKELDIHWRLFNKLPLKHVLAYTDQLKEFPDDDCYEWYLRAHLLVDFVSGMTDRYALELYQLLSGIQLS